MNHFNSAKEVGYEHLGRTVMIGDEKVYISSEFMLGKLLSGDGTKEDFGHFFKNLLFVLIILSICLPSFITLTTLLKLLKVFIFDS